MIRKITGWIILITMVALIFWDVYAYVYGGGRSTISVVITDFSFYTPAFPLIFGILVGHFFFPARGSDQ